MKYHSKALSMPKGISIGLAAELLLTAAGIFLLGQLIVNDTMQMENIGYGIVAVLICASFIGTAMAISRIRRQRLLVCLLCAGAFFLVLLSLTALFFGGRYEGVGVTAGLILAGSFSAGLLKRDRKSAPIKKKIP